MSKPRPNVHQRKLARVLERARIGKMAAEAFAGGEPHPILKARYEGQAQAFAMLLEMFPAKRKP
jgi:hypothetical protein